jgi:O-antigen/teichoic acid export membrane protein
MKGRTRIRDRLGRSHFARNVTLLAGATLVGQGIVLLVAPVLTRLFNPAAFGVAAVFSSVTSILYPLTSLRYELAIPLPSDERVGINLLGLSLILLIPTTAVVAVATWLAGPALLSATGSESITRYLWVIPVGLLIAGASQAATLWLVRVREFKPLARAKIAQGIGLAAIPLGGGTLIRPNPMWLVLGQLGGQAAGLGAIARAGWRLDREKVGAITREGMLAAARQFRRFPQISLGSGLLDSATLYAPSLLFAATYGIGVAGGFALSARVVGIPMTLLGQSVASVYLGEAPRAASGDAAELPRLYRQTARRLLVFGGIPLLAGGLLAPWASVWVFGPGWAQAGRFIQVLAPAYVAALVLSPVSQTLAVIGRLDLELYWTSARLVLVVASVVVSHKLGFSGEQAVGAYSLSLLTAYLALFALTSRAMKSPKRRSGNPVGQGQSPARVGSEDLHLDGPAATSISAER